jgi:ATP adenylyltransferase
VFCAARDADNDDDHYLITRHRSCFSILNLFPYNAGHLLVIPNKHSSSFADLEKECYHELWDVVRNWIEVCGDVLHPQGFNMGSNLGKAGGAGIDQHVHVHLVPRWIGDINFMSSIGDTKVISQDMHDTMIKLRTAYSTMFGNIAGV